jgi:hypothetical protein
MKKSRNARKKLLVGAVIAQTCLRLTEHLSIRASNERPGCRLSCSRKLSVSQPGAAVRWIKIQGLGADLAGFLGGNGFLAGLEMPMLMSMNFNPLRNVSTILILPSDLVTA